MTLQALGGGVHLAVDTASKGSPPLLEVRHTHTHTPTESEFYNLHLYNCGYDNASNLR
jgi:hypothetical protein